MKSLLKGKGALAVVSALVGMLMTPAAVLAANVKPAVKAALPSVVQVQVLDPAGKAVAGGSGVIVRRDGLVATNYHVIQGAGRARVVLHDGEALRVVGVRHVDAERDLAILQVEGNRLSAAALGDSTKLESGDEVIAIGAPLGLPQVVTTGIVSRIWVDQHRLIQHTAPISPGNSGGPLVTVTGQVVGLNTFLLDKGQNLNFAVPIQWVKQALTNLGGDMVSLRALNTAGQAIEERNRKEAEANFLSENFRRYEDPDGLFRLLLPKPWRVERSVSTGPDGSVTVLFMASDPEAEQARLNGWLSAGIRLRIVLPPKGRGWTEGARKEWAKEYLLTALRGYDRVIEASEPERVEWGGRGGAEFLVAGETRKLTAPELASLTLLPARDALVAIEVALPVQHKEAFAVLKAVFQESFSLGS